ncbi:Rossman fold protein, TIGR00730 family [Saccharothrix sp. ALI-22-I]|uniref:LOG family protein n=1 Tax=Saccharothrix sp. ALI-22-I TaxID=1933778 RepID=UPI00097C04F8|nr:TIGR00730 family Rossman fold protein [Saccharothrix sp. ALI-22-I]ONI87989.1 Rossman fold protein, TIGR00730 family [Saccharothrix sp. ALI-22-I]
MRVTLYAGSAPGNSPVFAREAERFVRTLVQSGCDIVYGGGSTGLMGLLADTALANGGRVIGVMPRSLVDAEIAHTGLDELHVVPTMHERKNLMAEYGECFVALPGGLGTLEELFEVWAALILGHHAKPIALLNVEGYWDPLLAMVDRMTATAFLRPGEDFSLIPVTDAEAFLAALDTWAPPTPRWATDVRTHPTRKGLSS